MLLQQTTERFGSSKKHILAMQKQLKATFQHLTSVDLFFFSI